MFIEFILNAAFSLAVLTYYIGVLIYSIPVPWYGLKRWAPLLIVDGIVASGLVLFFNNIILLIDYVYNLLGVDWGTYLYHLESLWSTLFLMVIMIEVFLTILTKIPIRIYVLSSMLFTIKNILSYGLLVLALIIIFSVMVKMLFTKFIALSILLYSVPFRIARTAGASLLAFAVVFYIGLPLMPNFMFMLALPETLPDTFNILLEYGVVYPRIHVESLHGDPIPYAILNVYGDNGQLLARYVASSDGWIYASYPDKGLPVFKEYKIEIEYYRFLFKTMPYKVDPAKHYVEAEEVEGTNLELRVVIPGILRLHNGILVFNNMEISYENITFSTSDILLTLSVRSQGEYQIIAFPKGYDIINITSNGTLIKYSITEINWYNNTIKILNITLNRGIYHIDIKFNGTGASIFIPSSIEKPYVLTATGGRSLAEVMRTAGTIYTILSVIFPTMYIVMLSMLAYGLASFLGARYPRIPMRVA